MGSRRQTAFVIGVVLVLVVSAMLATPGDERSSADPRASSFHLSPEGTRALYVTLEELGIPVERRMTSWRDGPPAGTALAMLAPMQHLTPFETDELLAWVEEGGTLLYASGRADPLLGRLGLAVGQPAGPGDEEAIRTGDAEPHAWAAGAGALPATWRIFDDTSAALVRGEAQPVLRSASGGVAVLVIPRGEGRIVAWSDAAPLRNRAIREAPGAALVFARAAAAATAEGDPLDFDEYHHGYREGAGPFGVTMRFFGERPEGRTMAQLAVVALGFLLLFGRRFGAPHPMPPPLRRSPLEHVEALASAYGQGGARVTARRLVLAGLARRLGRRVPAPGEEAAWLDRLAASHGTARGDVLALRDEWDRGGRADLVALSAAADSIATAYGRGARSPAGAAASRANPLTLQEMRSS